MARSSKNRFSHKADEKETLYYNVHLLYFYYNFLFSIVTSVCETSQLKFKVSPVGTNTRQQSLTPLLYRFHNDGMIKFVPLFTNSLLQMFDVSNPATIHPLSSFWLLLSLASFKVSFSLTLLKNDF